MSIEILAKYSRELSDRFFDQKDIDRILNWHAGTLEYMLHVYSHVISKGRYASLNTEVPYVTGAPNPGTKSNTKWADGMVYFGNGIGLLLEVKTIVCKGERIGDTVRKVPNDMAALLSADWKLTQNQKSDKYTDDTYWSLIEKINDPWGLQVTLLHGDLVPVGIEESINGLFENSVRSLEKKHGDTC